MLAESLIEASMIHLSASSSPITRHICASRLRFYPELCITRPDIAGVANPHTAKSIAVLPFLDVSPRIWALI
jgi:hypothetical protein